MIKALQGHFPKECFALYRRVLWRVVDSGTGEGIYRQTAYHARQMREIPGCEEAFAELMAEVVEKYSRRSGLMRALGDLAELGRSWQGRMHKERLEKLASRGLENLGLNDLAEICPIGEDEVIRAVGRSAYRSRAAFIWAILKKYGGKMDAADITTAIAEHRNLSPQSAGGFRSAGLKALEALGYVEIDREGNRMREVRLIKGQK